MLVTQIQRFCMHDGPGVRTTVFLKGCPLRCAWCHNPETQSGKSEVLYYGEKCIGCAACGGCKQGAHAFLPQHSFNRNLCTGCGGCTKVCPANALEASGRVYTVQALCECIEKDKAFYGERGGVTLSGGEPFAQPEEMMALLELCQKKGISTVVETCGYCAPEVVKRAVPLVDLFLWDVKDTDTRRHKAYTGVGNEQILSNLRLADGLGAKTIVRCILVNGVNTDVEHYKNIADLVAGLKNCKGVAFLPYHVYGEAKVAALGHKNTPREDWVPSKDQMAQAKAYMQNRGIQVM